ncbi:hypothetical protein R3P38DRAFT_3194331 [Favolaschia claudopus]|uniref:HTH La-type RNA-binding domain-containing protein n=1 Tax=Favolaschia claudopus TaxID=2862362 RepID=A0AAW0BBG2_9AGAR
MADATTTNDVVMSASEPAKVVEATTSSAALDPEDASTMQKAARQIEFYFADSNLPYDKFMWTLHTKTPEHWVPVATVASFKRMREFSSLGNEWVVRALREHSTQLEVDAEGVNVRRTTEVQEPKDQFERSVYAKGFPEESDTLQKRLEAFFEQYGPTNAVRMRLSVFTRLFSYPYSRNLHLKTRLLPFSPPTLLPHSKALNLLIMSKEEYCAMKIREKGLTGKAADMRKNLYSAGRKFDAFREMAATKKGGKATKDAPETKEVFLEFMGSTIPIQRGEDGTGEVKAEDIPFTKGATLRFEGIDAEAKLFLCRDQGKLKLPNPLREKFGRPPFIKHGQGTSWGLVGFHKVLAEDEIQFVKDTLPKIGDKDVAWTLAGEDEEKEFQVERAQSAAKAALEQAMGSGGRGRGGGRGGRGGRGGGRDRDGGGRGGGRGRGRGRGGRGGGRGARVEVVEKGGTTPQRPANGDDAQTGEKRNVLWNLTVGRM